MTSVSKIGRCLVLKHFLCLLAFTCSLLFANKLKASESGQVSNGSMSVFEKQNANDKVKIFDRFLNMKMTYAAFVWVLAQPLSEKNIQSHFDYAYQSEKQQLNVLFAVWQQLLTSGKYNNTSEIFYVMKKYYPYFTKYMDVFLSLTSKKPKTILPYYRNTFLARVLISEKEVLDPYVRTEKIINDIGWLILTPEFQFVNNDKNLGALMLELMAHADTDANNSLVVLAKKIRGQKTFSTSVKLLSAVKDIYEYGGGRLMSVAIAKPIQYFREMILGSAATIAKKNPMTTALTISSGLHALFFLQQKELAKVLQPMPEVESKFYSVKQVQVLKIAQLLAKTGNLLFRINREQTVGFSLPSVSDQSDLKKITTSADLYLKGLNYDFDFLNFFIQAESLKNTAGFDWQDRQTFDLIIALADKLKADVNAIAKTGDVKSVEELRKLLIGKYLHLYKRDNPSLLTVFLGWGGNCVSRTMLFVSLLKKYPELLPPDAKLYFGLYLDHMEPIMFYHGKYYLLMAGVVVERTRAVLYHSNDLIRIALSNLKPVSSKAQAVNGVLSEIPRSYFLNAVKFSEDDQIPQSADSNYEAFVEQKTDLALSPSSLSRANSLSGHKKVDRDCLHLIYSPQSSGGGRGVEYPFNLSSDTCLNVAVADFDIYIDFLKKESELKADPVKFLLREYNKYISAVYLDSDIYNYLKDQFVNFDFVTEHSQFEKIREKLKLYMSLRAHGFDVLNAIHDHKYAGLVSARPDLSSTYDYNSYVSLFSLNMDFNIYFDKASTSTKLYSDNFLQSEKNNAYFFKKFMANVYDRPFDFARKVLLASKVEQIFIKRIFRVTEFGYASFQESLDEGDGDLASELYYLAAPAHEVRSKIDKMGQGSIDLVSDNEIQLPEIKSAKTWRWGLVQSESAQEMRKQNLGLAKVQQDDLIGLMIFMQSGLQFWNKETVQKYLLLVKEKSISEQQDLMNFIFHNYHRLQANKIRLLFLQPDDLHVFVDLYLGNEAKNNKNSGGFKLVIKDPLNNPLPIEVYSVE